MNSSWLRKKSCYYSMNRENEQGYLFTIVPLTGVALSRDATDVRYICATTKFMATKKKTTKDYTEVLVDVIVEGMQEIKAYDIQVLDLRNVENAMADFFVICHGTSNTQVEAIARSVEREAQEKLTEKPWHIEGTGNSQWILMDYVNVIVHIFDEPTRPFYALEELWADADFRKIAS